MFLEPFAVYNNRIMIKSLRVPERLFQIAMWLVSFFFAAFLIGLGGKIVGDLPGVDQRLTLEQFIDATQVVRNRVVLDSLGLVQRGQMAARERAQLRLNAAANTYRNGRASFDNWIATRTATTDPSQDPEVVQRTRELDALKSAEQTAQAELDRLNADILRASQAAEEQQRRYTVLQESARGRYDAALFRQELRVFAIRLALTLPLLILAAWLVMKKRKSQYWPLAPGFVLFALFAFFVELVPYLPSYGGVVGLAGGGVAAAPVRIPLIRAPPRHGARGRRGG